MKEIISSLKKKSKDTGLVGALVLGKSLRNKKEEDQKLAIGRVLNKYALEIPSPRREEMAKWLLNNDIDRFQVWVSPNRKEVKVWGLTRTGEEKKQVFKKRLIKHSKGLALAAGAAALVDGKIAVNSEDTTPGALNEELSPTLNRDSSGTSRTGGK